MFELYNGDCIDIMHKLIERGVKVDAVICDLPYGTSRCKKWDFVIPFDELWKCIKQLRKDYIPIVLFGKEPFSSMLRMSNIDEFKYDWIWKKDTKSNFPQAPYQPLNNIEIISVFSNGYARYGEKKMPYYPQMTKGEKYTLPKESKTTSIFAENHKNGIYRHKDRDTSLRYPYNILEFNTDKSHLHPTQKPITLLEYLVKTYTKEGDLVMDMTMGSGTTGVACRNLNRGFIGIELNKEYFEIANKRINEVKKHNNIMVDLHNGDCLELMKFIPDNSVDMVLCDLPYGCTAQEWDTVIDFCELWKQYDRIRKEKCPVVLFSSQPFTTMLISSNISSYKYCWYWSKNQTTNFFHAKRMPLRKIEEICVFYKHEYNPQKTDGHIPTRSAKGCSNGTIYFSGKKRNYEGGDTTRYPNNLLEFNCVNNYHKVHPNEKPVELLEYLIKTYTNEGDTVLDNTMGSGSTGVASVNLNRNFIGIELNKEYFEIANKRINEVKNKITLF